MEEKLVLTRMALGMPVPRKSRAFYSVVASLTDLACDGDADEELRKVASTLISKYCDFETLMRARKVVEKCERCRVC